MALGSALYLVFYYKTKGERGPRHFKNLPSE